MTNEKNSARSVESIPARPTVDATHQTILELATLVADLTRRVLDGNGKAAEPIASPTPPRISEQLSAARPVASPDDKMTVAEVAAELRVTSATVREHIKAGRLVATRGVGGRTYLVKRGAIEKFLNAGVGDDQEEIKRKTQDVLNRFRSMK